MLATQRVGVAQQSLRWSVAALRDTIAEMSSEIT